jgi:hypothetical protein
MLKLLKNFLWLVVILTLAIGFDQLMVKLPLTIPGLQQTQRFYIDFRTRLLNLTETSINQDRDTIEKIIKKTVPTPAILTNKPTRYLYVDKNGTLQFADSLQQIPINYRQDAQPLAE